MEAILPYITATSNTLMQQEARFCIPYEFLTPPSLKIFNYIVFTGYLTAGGFRWLQAEC
jgi:hypothetical protein